MDELPELPFKQVLSYLNLKDRLNARAVSRAWRNTFDRYPVNTLCYSSRSSDFIFQKSRWVSGAFAQNFINSNRFAMFFDSFVQNSQGQTILSSLKHLRLCKLNLTEGDRTTFVRTLDSFRQLEELDIIEARLDQQDVVNLNLPMLTSLQLENVDGIEKLTLEAPRLREVNILECSYDLKVEIVHSESIERLLVDWLIYTEVKKLKNLQYLYVKHYPTIDSTLLSSLQQLKEVHTNDPDDVSWLFEQKQRLGRADLKIYICGLLLNGPDDQAINALNGTSSSYLNEEWLVCLAENRPRLADLIPFYRQLHYSAIVVIAPGLEVDLLKGFTNLKQVIIDGQVQDTQRFLNLLKNRESIALLWFKCDQLQDLFDQLPEHCTVQQLILWDPPSDIAFLFRLKHLIHLNMGWSIGRETVRRTLEELPALSYFGFRYDQETVSIEIGQPKQFQVSFDWLGRNEEKTVPDLNTAIESIFGNQ